MDHNARIVISADAAGIKATNDELVKLGKTDQKNADQFKKHHDDGKKRHKEQLDFNTKLTHSFAELGEGIIAAFAVEKIIEWGAECVKEFEEAEQSANQLKFAVTNLSGESNKAFEELTEKAEQLSKSLGTLYTSDQIKKAQTFLLQTKLNSEQVGILMPRLADIAAKTGKTLDEVSQSFGKAISEGRSGALTQFGLKFKDTGTIVGNFNKVMESSAKYIGGAADAMGDLASQEQIAANKVTELQEAIGSKLAPAWVSIKNGILGAIESEFEFFGTMKDALSGKDINWTDLAKQYVNALTLGLTGLETSTVKLEEYHKKVAAMRGAQITLEIADLIRQRNEGELTQQEYLKHLEILSEVNKKLGEKGVEMEQEHLTDLKNLTDKQLEERLEFAKEEDNIIGKYTTAGFAKEAARVEKEIELRKKGAEEQKKIREKQLKDEAEYFKIANDQAQKIIDEMIKAESDRVRNSEEINNLLLKKEEQTSEALLESQKLALKKRFDAGKITKAQYEKQTQELENKNRVENSRLELDNVKENNKAKAILLKQHRDMNLITEEEYNKELLKLDVEQGEAEIKLQKDLNKLVFDLRTEEVEKTKKLIQGVHEFSLMIISAVTASIESSIGAIDTQMDRQNKMIEYQKVLAEKGLENDLAFEERRADELTKKKLDEQKKLRKAKELETFLNALAKYAEENPNTALGKALALVATAKISEALFMEDGGIIGQTNTKSFIGPNQFSRRHRSGGDMLIHGQVGEGVIPKDKMRDWGLTNSSLFSSFLKNPLTTIPLPVPGKSVYINNNDAVVEKLDRLEQVLINNPSGMNINWDELDQRIEERIRNGVKTVTTIRKSI